MTSPVRFTSADLEVLPYDSKRYEIIDGELFVSRTPHSFQQIVCSRAAHILEEWNDREGLGRVVVGPGVVFAEDDDAVPDVAWITLERWLRVLDAAGHLTRAPELVIEVLSP